MADAFERILFVHAHPDDESIATGGTIATLVDRGAEVSVLTCTRGELGEVVPEAFRAELSSPAALGSRRESELVAALAALGVTDHLFLGSARARFEGRAPRQYLDSGMQWGPGGPAAGAEAIAHVVAGSLTAADFGEVASDIATAIANYEPDVVVSYDAHGGYGHPDHIRAREATQRAADVLGVPFYEIQQADAAAPPTLAVDVSPVLDRKRAALRAHATQVVVDGDRFALADGAWHPIATVENFRRVLRSDEPDPTAFAQQGLVTKIASSALALVLGFFVGALLTVIHQATAQVASISVPWGIVAAIAISIALLVGLRLVFGSRVITALAAVGLVAAVVVLSLQGAGGSILVPANPAGYIWTFAPVVIALAVLAWPRSWRRTPGRIVTNPAAKGATEK
ncbi:MAG: PIG-L family deacetylase [Rhodoglobus sp.]